MKTIIGIDVGGSTTKIVGFNKNGDRAELIEPLFVRATDAITSVYGAFGKFTDENRLAISDVDKVMMTGVGSSYVKRDLYGLDCRHVPEFHSIGRGGLYLSGLSEALVVSMGTGTALVHAKTFEEMKYLGGTGVGGGTIMGLSKLLLQAESIEHIADYAETGDLSKVDLRIGDLTSRENLAILSRDLTASNFGNVSDIATREDIALGILNMVFETIGMVSVFAAHEAGTNDIVLTGNLTRFPHCEAKFRELNGLKENYGVNFIIPDNARFSTVIGTALSGL